MKQRPFSTDPSASTSFERIKQMGVYTNNQNKITPLSHLKAVVIGGGTGAPMSIGTLLSMGIQTSAVVAMADDGGSTGKLRECAGVTPPGDIRKCLAAFAYDRNDPLTKAFKYRFEFANNHTLGNLMLSALEDATGSFPEAIAICEELLHARGHVYPSTLDEIVLCAETYDESVLRGQARASHSDKTLKRVWLESKGEVSAYSAALKAIDQADLIVLGPGSLFTSIIPNLLVPGISDAIKHSRAKTIFVCSLADMQGETWGLSAAEYVEALMQHGMQDILDYALIHSFEPLQGAVSFKHNLFGRSHAEKAYEKRDKQAGIRRVYIDRDQARAIQDKGCAVMVRDFVDPERLTWHNPVALRQAFEEVIEQCHLLTR